MKETIRYSCLAVGAVLVVWLIWLETEPSARDGARGADSPPRQTFELGLRYIRDGEYDRVWSLYTPRRQDEMEDEFEKQKLTLARETQTGGPNLDVLAKFTVKQYGLSPADTMRTPAPELFSRNLERTREQRLTLRIVGDIEIDGDVATFRVAEGDGPPAKWTLRRQSDGRWLIDETETGPPR